MAEDIQKQLELMPIGEGEGKKKPLKKWTTEALLWRGNECITLCRSNKVQFALYAGKVEAWRKAIAGEKTKWAKLPDGEFLPLDIAKLIVKFVDNYKSNQCELIAEMREIQKVLKTRKIGFVFSDELYPDGGC